MLGHEDTRLGGRLRRSSVRKLNQSHHEIYVHTLRSTSRIYEYGISITIPFDLGCLASLTVLSSHLPLLDLSCCLVMKEESMSGDCFSSHRLCIVSVRAA